MNTQASAPAETISLPTGGGALKGIGETFSPDLHTGTGNFTIPLALPPGRNGFQPKLDLAYSTGSGNGPFGLGWSLGVPAISRRTARGIPRYRDADGDDAPDTFVLGGDELVRVDDGSDPAVRRYRPRTEGLFARIEHHVDTDSWVVESRDGLVSRYGTSAGGGARAVVADLDTPGRTFSWHLSETVDPFGNRIVYEYRLDAGGEAPGRWCQLYLHAVRWIDFDEAGVEGFLASVVLAYENRPDPVSDRRAGFHVRTRRRCTRVDVRTHAGQTRVVRSYRLGYLDQPEVLAARPDQAVFLPRNGVSLLGRVTVTGHNASGSESLPPLDLEYSRFEPEGRRFVSLSGPDLPAQPLGTGGVELVDLFGRGLPDLLEMNGRVRYWRNLGGGRFDRARTMSDAPAGVALHGPGVQLLDADGDGRAELLVTRGAQAGWFALGEDGGWDRRSFRPYAVAPSFSLDDPEVRLVDLDGDGVTDALRAGARLECWFSDPDQGWGEAASVDRSALEGLEGLSFTDPRVRMADMSGDGLQDLVVVRGRSVEYWPSLGRGRWGRPVRMADAPVLPWNYDPRRLLLGDVDGDGAADLVYVEDGCVTLWLNRVGEGWSAPVIIRGTPRVADTDTMRLADVFGNGVAGVLWSGGGVTAGRAGLRFLDFTGGVKPYLLTGLDAHLGSVTRVEYAPSTRFRLADEAVPALRWRTPLPFPVHVVSRSWAIDQLSGRWLTTEYSYHHGYWDGEEREFRGFGRVDWRDAETVGDGGPGGEKPAGGPARRGAVPRETRTWFHPGAVRDGSGGWRGAEYAHELWPEPGMRPFPSPVLPDSTAADARARRDALRTLRGRVLREEVYALDGSPLSARPFTVVERAYAVREEDADTAAGRRRIFFPHEVAARTTQWDRGDEPMTTFSFTGDYDGCGQPRLSLSVAVPRGRDPYAAGDHPEPYLCTVRRTAHATPPEGRWMMDRVACVTEHEIVGAREGSVEALRAAVMDGVAGAAPTILRVIGQTLSFYDGPAFEGLPLGCVGATGALVRTEDLVLTADLLHEAYGDTTPPWFAGDGADWSGYPAEIAAAAAAGYRHREREAGSPVAGGWYAPSIARAYDVQRDEFRPRGLVRRTRDPWGNETHLRYCRYQHLPRKVSDAAGLVTRAEHDFLVLQTRRLRGPTGDRTEVRYTPLGQVECQLVLARPGEPWGDTAEHPSLRYLYDLHAFARRGQPVSIRTIRRVHHVRDTSVPAARLHETVESVEYSDGLGRLLQTRAQGPEAAFGDETHGAGVLDERPGGGGDVVGMPAHGGVPRVVVSGWTVRDGKGRPVEQYEPFFALGWEFAPAMDAQLGARSELEYDARGRAVRTIHPDGSETRAVYGVPAALESPSATVTPTPWEHFIYSRGDNAGRTHPVTSAGWSHHRDTPTSNVVDALGRTVQQVARTRAAEPGAPVQEVSGRKAYDIRGNVVATVDALGRTAERTVFDLAGRSLRVVSLDGGVQVSVHDAAGRPLESTDARGARALHAYDVLGRPVLTWTRDEADAPLRLCERLEYGDGGDVAQDPAVRAFARTDRTVGRPVRHYDGAGLLSVSGYDLHGQPLSTTRRTISDARLRDALAAAAADAWRLRAFRVDWTPPAGVSVDEHAEWMLEADGHTTGTVRDALGRARILVMPADTTGMPRVLETTFDPSGALRSVRLDGVPYVEHIAYNARGDRTLVAYGNGVMTRCAYDPLTGRLVRLRSERYVRPAAWTFRPAPRAGEAHVLQDVSCAYDLEGNPVRSTDRTPGCGVRGNPEAAAWVQTDPGLAALLAAGDALVRHFTYDPLGRLLSATGREGAQGAASPRPWHDAPRAGFGGGGHATPDMENAPALSVLYAEQYAYDFAGNLLSLRHRTGEAAWTRHFGFGGRTPAAWAEAWATHAGGAAWNDAPSNRLTHAGDDDPTAPVTHAYDAAGNLVRERGSTRFAWDHAGRLALFARQTPAGGSAPEEDRWAEPSVCALYLYDSAGGRVKKIVRTQGGGVETTVYAGGIFELQRWTRADGTGGACTLHSVMDDRRRIAVVRTGDRHPDDGGPAVQFHLVDVLESSTVVTDAAGGWVNREEYLPYGETAFGSFARKRFRFTGKERDGESGLSYHGARYYAPWLCRWASPDPAGLVDGPNLYAYVVGNPMRLTDPGGTQAVGANERTRPDVGVSGTASSTPDAGPAPERMNPNDQPFGEGANLPFYESNECWSRYGEGYCGAHARMARNDLLMFQAAMSAGSMPGWAGMLTVSHGGRGAPGPRAAPAGDLPDAPPKPAARGAADPDPSPAPPPSSAPAAASPEPPATPPKPEPKLYGPYLRRGNLQDFEPTLRTDELGGRGVRNLSHSGGEYPAALAFRFVSAAEGEVVLQFYTTVKPTDSSGPNQVSWSAVRHPDWSLEVPAGMRIGTIQGSDAAFIPVCNVQLLEGQKGQLVPWNGTGL